MPDFPVFAVKQDNAPQRGMLPVFFFVLFCFAGFFPAFAFGAGFEEDFSTPLATPSGERASSGFGPALRIIYCAESKGELFPCPTCGSNALGGLARRSAKLSALRAEAPNSVHIIGPGEFLPDGAGIIPTAADTENKYPSKQDFSAREVLEAYRLTRPDAVYLSIASAAWFKQAKVSLPASFQAADKSFPVKIIRVGERKLGLVFMPPLESESPSEADRQKFQLEFFPKALSVGRELRSRTDLVIGVSSWGQAVEESFLAQADGVFDVILGGGEGVPFPVVQRKSAHGILWLRADMRGRAINVLDLSKWPSRQAALADPWIEDLNFRAEQIYLGPNIQDDAAVNKILLPGK